MVAVSCVGLGINGEGEGVASFVVVLRDFNGWILGYIQKESFLRRLFGWVNVAVPLCSLSIEIAMISGGRVMFRLG